MSTRAVGGDVGMATRVSRVVRLLMTLNDENQSDVARVLGVPQSAVSARLRGQTKWTVDDLELLARHYGKPITTFFIDPEQVLNPEHSLNREGLTGRDTVSCRSRGMRTRHALFVRHPVTAS